MTFLRKLTQDMLVHETLPLFLENVPAESNMYGDCRSFEEATRLLQTYCEAGPNATTLSKRAHQDNDFEQSGQRARGNHEVESRQSSSSTRESGSEDDFDPLGDSEVEKDSDSQRQSEVEEESDLQGGSESEEDLDSQADSVSDKELDSQVVFGLGRESNSASDMESGRTIKAGLQQKSGQLHDLGDRAVGKRVLVSEMAFPNKKRRMSGSSKHTVEVTGMYRVPCGSGSKDISCHSDQSKAEGDRSKEICSGGLQDDNLERGSDAASLSDWGTGSEDDSSDAFTDGSST